MNGGRLRYIEPSWPHSTVAARPWRQHTAAGSKAASVRSTARPSPWAEACCPGPASARRKAPSSSTTLLDHAGYIPAFVVITAGTQHEVAIARGLRLPQGRIVAMDRGDIDDRSLFRRHQDGGYCVTRQQGNARVQVTARVVVARGTDVTSDHHVILVAQQSAASPTVWRRVGYRDSATGKPDVFWTNAFPWQPRRLPRSTRNGGKSSFSSKKLRRP